MRFKDVKVILAIILVLTWIVGGVLGFFYYNHNKKELNKKEETITQLQANIDSIGELVTVYKVASDVKMGKKIEETDLLPTEVPIGTASNFIQSPSEIVGGFYRIGLSADTVINRDTVTTTELSDDLRLLDVVVNNVPVGLKPDTYVDIRITLPLGEDFIAMAHKKVYAINNGVLKVAVSEKDIHTYNSMLIDSLLYPGTSLYAVEYVEGGAQKAADVYYPVSNNILAIAQKDPNLLDAIKSDMIQKRALIDNGLSQLDPEDGRVKEAIDITLQRGREKYQNIMTDAARAAQIAEEKAAEAARLQNGG